MKRSSGNRLHKAEVTWAESLLQRCQGVCSGYYGLDRLISTAW